MTKKDPVKYPKGETCWVGFYIEGNPIPHHIITSKPDRSLYYIYAVEDGGGKLTKLGKGKNPKELERKYIVRSK